MGEDIVSLVNQLALEARPKILALCTLTWEERERTLNEEKERREHGEEVRSNWSLDGALDLGNAKRLGCSAAKILLENGNPSAAKEIYARYDYYLEAANAARKQGMQEEARNYVREAIKKEKFSFWFHQYILEAAEFFSEHEIENEMQPLLEKYENRNIKRTLVEAVIAKKLGQQEKLEKLYRESKKRLDKACKAEEKYHSSEDHEADCESLECAAEETSSQAENLAELCIIMNRYDEAVELLGEGTNEHWVLDEPLASALDKREKEYRELRYNMFLDDAVMHTSPKDFLTGAKAAEKLGSKEAEKYYQEALKQKEEMLYLGTAFEIAKKLKLKEKLKTYTAIAAYLHEHKNI